MHRARQYVKKYRPIAHIVAGAKMLILQFYSFVHFTVLKSSECTEEL